MSILELLQRRYPAKEYSLMAEVRDASGFNASRSADFIAVNLWPSRGLAINGIELKSFRNDWLSELKNPKKAESIFKYCDNFWLLTTDDTIAKIDEIPISWGWMCVKGSRIVVKKEAPTLYPEPVTRTFLCSMLKRAGDKTQYVHVDSIMDRIDSAADYEKNKKDKASENTMRDYQTLLRQVKEFKEASGIDLKEYYRWETSPEKIGKAVKFIEGGGGEALKKELLDLEWKAKNIYDRIVEGIKLF